MSDINFKVGWLKDPADNQKFAPKTTTNQVLTGDGERLTDLINRFEENKPAVYKGDGQYAVTIGAGYANGVYSVAEGYNTYAAGQAAHAEGAEYNGNRVTALGQASHAEGAGSQAVADGAHAEGILTTSGRGSDNAAVRAAKSLNIHGSDEELVMKMRGYGAHAEGSSTEALGSSAHAEGNSTSALANASHAEGDTTTSSGEASHAEGYDTKALGNQSHSEGKLTIASGNSSHAEGSQSQANAYTAHAEGLNTRANGLASHTEGTETIASSENQHVQGKFNVVDTENKYAHIVGNGEDNDIIDEEGTIIEQKRSNAHTLDWNGNAWFKGEIFIGGSSQIDENAKKLITNAVNDLQNYYTKTEVEDVIKSYTDPIPKFGLEIVQTRPAKPSTGKENYIFLVSNGGVDGYNVYTEYIYKNNRWEILGEQKLDLSGYAKKEDFDSLLDGADDDYNTLKKLGDLIDENVDAINSLEEVVSNKAAKDHTHTYESIINLDTTYETKVDATNKLAEAKLFATSEAKSYATSEANRVKNELLNGAGEAYDTLKELGSLIDENVYAIEALEIVATNKADKEHTHEFIAEYGSTTLTELHAAKVNNKDIKVVRNFEQLAPGAYDADDNMIYSWQELLDMDVEYEEFDGYDETGTNIWTTKVGKCVTVEDGALKSIVTYSPSTDSYTNWSRNALVDVTKLVIDNSVTTINYNGLTGFKIKEFILPNTLTTIEEDAFSYIDSAVIYIPRSVTNISFRAFYGSWYLMIKYEGTEEAFNTIASIIDFNMNAHELMYSYNCRVLHDPIYGYLKNATENNFVFTSREDTGEVEYICNSYGWSTRNIQMIKLGDAIFKYDYENKRVVLSFAELFTEEGVG